MQVKTKFWGKSMEVEPTGFINIKLNKYWITLIYILLFNYYLSCSLCDQICFFSIDNLVYAIEF